MAGLPVTIAMGDLYCGWCVFQKQEANPPRKLAYSRFFLLVAGTPPAEK